MKRIANTPTIITIIVDSKASYLKDSRINKDQILYHDLTIDIETKTDKRKTYEGLS